MKKTVLSIFFVLVFLLSVLNVQAIGLSPGKREFEFTPGMDINHEIILLSNMGTVTEVRLTAEIDPQYCCALNSEEDKSLLSKVQITPDVFDMSPGEVKNVKIYIDLPYEFENPGQHVVLIRAQEYPKNQEGMIGAVAAVRSVIKINVPYPGKYIEYTSDIKHPSVGEKSEITLDMINRGEETINNLKVTILVLDSLEATDERDAVGKYTKTLTDIEPLENLELVWNFDSSSLREGEYKVVFQLEYDGIQSMREAILRVGTKDVSLIDWTDTINLFNPINRFDTLIENRWNEKLDSVFAETTFFNSGGSRILTIKTPSEPINAWDNTTLSAYLDSSKFNVGDYEAEIKINFDGNTRTYRQPVKFISEEVVEEEMKEPMSLTTKLIIGAIILVILIILINILVMKKLSKDIEQEKEN